MPKWIHILVRPQEYLNVPVETNKLRLTSNINSLYWSRGWSQMKILRERSQQNSGKASHSCWASYSYSAANPGYLLSSDRDTLPVNKAKK
jgi:hypothetical protein